VFVAARRADHAIETWLEKERDQIALWLPVGLGLGIAGWFILSDARAWTIYILLLLGLAGMCFALARGGRMERAIGIFALTAACGCGLVWWRSGDVAAVVLERPVVTRFVAQVEAVQMLPARDLVRLTVSPDSEAGLPPRVRVNVAVKDMPMGAQPGIGAKVALRARLMPPAPPAVPGAYDFARVAWFQGIGATGRALEPVTLVSPASGAGMGAWLAERRATLSGHIQGSSPTGGGIAAALATGDQGGIADEDAEAMRRSGLAHLLSISGLHVTAVVAATMLLLLRLLALSPRLALHMPLLLVAAGGGAVAGIAYTLLSGAEVPTIRSCIAALLVLAGIAMGREAITLRLVATGALVVLLFRPEALAGPSFQLSFAAITAIVALHEHPRLQALFARREEAWQRRVGRGLLSLLITGMAVELALSPIALFHFHRSGLYGALANIVAIPLTTFVIMPLEAASLMFDTVGLGAPLWWLTGHALAVLLGIAHVVAGAPGAVAALPTMPPGAFAAMLAGGLWIALWRTRVRRLGLFPLAIGAAWALTTPAPDLLVTGDGRHLALRGEDGSLAVLRPRAGDYVRGLLGEASGVQGAALDLDATPGARCGPDLCAIDLLRGRRRWRIVATRSSYLIDITAMNRACASADIVVSDRRLPRSCLPRWLKIDRPLLEQTGGLSIDLATGRIRSVVRPDDRHPWIAGR
jgi:competence protein ComEC